MDYESICGSLQTVRAARMFYEYGKLDRLLERDITTSSDDLYEVYYEQSPEEWECIYRTRRTRDDYSDGTRWDEWYALDELHMTQAGTYRLVRQVNSYRQVLQLTLDER